MQTTLDSSALGCLATTSTYVVTDLGFTRCMVLSNLFEISGPQFPLMVNECLIYVRFSTCGLESNRGTAKCWAQFLALNKRLNKIKDIWYVLSLPANYFLWVYSGNDRIVVFSFEPTSDSIRLQLVVPIWQLKRQPWLNNTGYYIVLYLKPKVMNLEEASGRRRVDSDKEMRG